MALSQFNGPLIVGYPGAGVITAIPVSPDLGPSQFFCGVALIDPRFSYRAGGGTENNALLQIGVGVNGGYLVCDQAPSTKAANNIAAAANVTSGTALTLVSTTGAGVTVTSTATFIPQTGNTVASGALALDGVPALVFFGTNKSTAVADPAKNLSRVVTITGVAGGAGGNFLVTGNDLYGYPQTQLITATSGATTTASTKAFKFVRSVVPQFTDAHNYSVGTGDVFGFPVLSQEFPLATVGWAGALIASSTGYVAAVSTAATNTTGDVRGTYAVQSASNGTIVLQVFQTITPANLALTGTAGISGYFGVTPA